MQAVEELTSTTEELLECKFCFAPYFKRHSVVKGTKDPDQHCSPSCTEMEYFAT